ncbi:MAG: glycoside hydrolase family 2 [Algicola sp.]|nr:glycoside hydrolase family 2 [Algicola sp.]
MNKLIGLSLFVCVAFSLQIFAQQKTINSGWQYSEDTNTWESVNIPHTWNKTDAFDDQPGYRRGLGYYKKIIFIQDEQKNHVHYLKFNAVNQEATVRVNGQIVGNHKGGYTAFNFEVTNFLKFGSYNLIEVTVDNSHNLDIPPLDADFTFYGGIYRDVELIALPKQHFSLDDDASEGFYVNYLEVSDKSASIEVDAILKNVALVHTPTNLNLVLLDHKGDVVTSRTETLELPAEETTTFKVKLPQIENPKLWSPETPNLYQLELTLTTEDGHVLDVKSTNIGFRWASVDPEKGFFLNGKSIKLIGVNRHQDFQGYANAVPTTLQEKDMELIKNMGANIIRFAHYPHARELYDLCDKLGIIVWTEIPIVNKVTDSEAFFETCMTMQKEHIKQYYNYPSVIMFGYMNEIFLRMAFGKSSEASKAKLKASTLELANQLEDVTRQLAPNHITVMACHLNEVYNETGIADLPMLLGWNLYFGWYDAEISDLGTFLDDQHKRFPKRSLLLSEYGPGADVRIFTRTPKNFDFSTDYQFKLHQSYYQQITDRPFMTGMTAWNFADFGSEFRGDAIPHVNQKGLVRYDRTPKDIYYWYKSVLVKDEKFIHLAVNHLNGMTLLGNDSFPVKMISNLNEAQVFLNGQLLEKVVFNNGVSEVDVPFVNGKNILHVESDVYSVEKSLEISRLEQLHFKDFKQLGINVGAHFYFKDLERQTTFVPDQAYEKGWFGYENGTPFGMTKTKNQGIPHNIKNTTSEPLFQTMLEGVTRYKVDLPTGYYKASLFFVEPKIKPTENIYNLSKVEVDHTKTQRIFNVLLNDSIVEEQFNLARAYPEKYGVTLTSNIRVNDDEGLTISLNPIVGQPVLSGILIEKIN